MSLELLNALLWILFLYILYRRKASLVSMFVIGIWAFSAVLGIFYVDSEVYRDGLYNVTLEPFLYLLACMAIAVYPTLKLNQSISISAKNEDVLYLFSIGISLLAYLASIELIFNLAEFIITGQFVLLGANYDDVANGEESLIEVSMLTLHIQTLMSAFKVVTPVLFFYYLNKGQKRWITWGLFLASLIPTMYNITLGSKTELVFFILYFSCLYLFFRPSLKPEIKRFTTKIVLSLGGVAFAMVLALTIGRYTMNTNRNVNVAELAPTDFLFQYSAESMYNFNQNIYEENPEFHGYCCALPVLNYMGISHVKLKDRRDFLRRKARSPMQLFYSYAGDIYMDCGPYLALFIVTLVSYLFHLIKIKQKMHVGQICILAMYLYILATSLFYFCFKLHYETIIGTLLFGFIFAVIPPSSVNKKQ